MSRDRIALFSLDTGGSLGQAVSAALGEPLARHEERVFEDGEHKARPLDSVRGADAYVLSSLHGDATHTVNDKLVRLWFFIATLKDAGAARVTAVAPFLAYARKDQRSKPRDPVATRYVAAMFEAAGVDALVTVDAHNVAAYQNAFRCRTEHLQARPLLVEHLARELHGRPLAVVSPDVGAVKRAEAFRQSLEQAVGEPVTSGFVEKYRSDGRVTGGTFVGEVRDRVAIVVDDLISAGTTMARAAQSCASAGATAVYAVATHAVFAAGVEATLAEAQIEKVVVTDTIARHRPLEPALSARLDSVTTAPLLAEAIRRLHDDDSLVELDRD